MDTTQIREHEAQRLHLLEKQPPTPSAAAVAKGLRQGGMATADVGPWVDLTTSDGFDTASLIRAGLAWHRGGIDSKAATEWFQMDGWTPQNALPWYLADFTPSQAELCDGLIFYAELQRSAGEPKPSEVGDWLQCGLPAAWVCRALLLGLNTVHQARRLYEERSEDRHFAGTIDLLRDVYGPRI